jgi:UDP-N-acetylglucosamine 2-epimerase (hydrolysing)
MGSEIILSAYKKLRNNPHFVIYPSLRFEYFLTLLYNSEFIIGNSSAGIREACIYGIPAIDIGDRQRGRYDMNIIKNIQHVDEDIAKLLNAIDKSEKYKISSSYYGFGDSAQKFIEIISKPDFWNLDVQKKFIDRS